MTTKQHTNAGQTTAATGTSTGGQRVPAPSDDPAITVADVEQTQAELDETVDALAAGTDAPGRAREKTDTAKAWIQEKAATGTELARQGVQRVAEKTPQATEQVARAGRAVRENPKPALLAAVAALFLLLLRRRRRNR